MYASSILPFKEPPEPGALAQHGRRTFRMLKILCKLQEITSILNILNIDRMDNIGAVSISNKRICISANDAACRSNHSSGGRED